MKSIFEYKYKSNLIDIMEFLKNKKIEYIEIPPIIPKHAEMYLPLQKEFSNKGIYTIASFNINFNIINKVLIERKVKNCYTAVKGVYKNKESTYIYIQCTDIEKNVKQEILKYIKDNKYNFKAEDKEKQIKVVLEIDDI